MRIELDVRVIPQLYGSAMDRPAPTVDGIPPSTPAMDWRDFTDDEKGLMSRWRPLEFDQNGAQSHLGPSPPYGHLGSCLSASLEMMLDYHRRTAANASSSFHGVVPRMARKARPNGDVVNMYWNQALLHHQIWGQKTRLLDFVLRSSRLMDSRSSARVRRNAGMFEAITYSLQPEHHGGSSRMPPVGPNPVRNERRRMATTSNAEAYRQPIIHHLRDMQEPLLVCVDNFHVIPPAVHGGPPDNWLIDGVWEDHDDGQVLPWASVVRERPTREGHAMVLAGFGRWYGSDEYDEQLAAWSEGPRYPDIPREEVVDDLARTGQMWVKLLDPSPSLMLEDHPERFFSNPPHEAMNPDLHVHWVRLDELLPCIDRERGLMVLRKPSRS